MIKSVKMAVIALSLVLTGCAATVNKPGSSTAAMQLPAGSSKKIVMTVKASPAVTATADWKIFQEQWRAGMAAATASKGLNFSFHDAESAPASEAGALIGVKINDYRYVSAGARIGLGVMTGNAFLDAEVAFSDLQTQRLVGTRKYHTTSSAWDGIFAAMTDKQVLAVSNEIVAEIVNYRAANANATNAAPVAPVTTNETATTYAVQPQASVSNVADSVASTPVNTSASVQAVEFRVGSSSVTVEKMAKQAGCVGGKGAGLVTPKGAVEVYRMACDNGGNFVAKCEMRQCSAM
ncbi:DUF4410 domain-containing protein [Undibacterium parvum]|uniref:DUF4410 domain-containing protein n=1 Tax=Undibacterium parvum TaxID=401471 RepID=A0A3Q9BPN8_9BURK|nr:DUF4410 domain-containing protein [Undibacterium parvum]AZP11657.1 DUF4410 domain-containing protein [Undibacterium parvum]